MNSAMEYPRQGLSFLNSCQRIGPIVALMFACSLPLASATAQLEGVRPPRPADSATDDETGSGFPMRDDEGELRFAFGGTAWRDVIEWLAEEGDLALHIDEVPTGSFTYTDPGSYTPDEAIARINIFLLPQGFTLVRTGRLLSIINLADPRGLQQLEALARLVTPEDLDELPTHEVVKCFFVLGDINAEDAVEELTALNLLNVPSVFNRTNRLMITDTVGKLRIVNEILAGFEPSGIGDGLVMKNFELQHLDAEDVLAIARPHLGLATGESIGIDISVSTDLQGKYIFATGIEERVKLIEDLIESLDHPSEELSLTDGSAVLKAHVVPGGNVETIYNVLITLLAGKTVRLSMDETAGAIVALASPEVQAEIEQTVEQLQAAEAEFEAIPLRFVDPFLVVSLLEEMLDLPDPIFDDPEDEGYNHDAPRIDADPANKKLYVRGKRHQIDRVKAIVAELDVDSRVGSTEDDIRVFPMRGAQAIAALETVAKFWRRDNLIILLPPLGNASLEHAERVVADDESTTESISPSERNQDVGRVLAGDIRSTAPDIRCQPTPRGLLIQSDDLEALNELLDSLYVVAGPVDAVPSAPVVFFLKYTKPVDAIRMLAELLDGGEAASRGDTGSLVNGFVSSGSLLGSLITSRDGTVTMTGDTMTVVADPRLNRLIAQGTTNDIETIERYLKIIDKDSSITSVEIYGRSRVIELQHSNANDVAETLREAYASRLTGRQGGFQDPRQQQGRGGQQGGDRRGDQRPDQRDEEGDQQRGDNEQRNDQQRQGQQGQQGGQSGAQLEPTMTIAVHEPSNSLIITAQDQLYREVEALVKLIDQRNAKVVDFIQIEDRAVMDSLRAVLGDQDAANGGQIQFSIEPRRTFGPNEFGNQNFGRQRGTPNQDRGGR